MLAKQTRKLTNQRHLLFGGKSWLLALILLVLLAPLSYAQLPAPQEAGGPVTGPSVTVAGTAAATLPVTGESILWIVIVGGIVLTAGVFLFLRTKKAR